MPHNPRPAISHPGSSNTILNNVVAVRKVIERRSFSTSDRLAIIISDNRDVDDETGQQIIDCTMTERRVGSGLLAPVSTSVVIVRSSHPYCRYIS